MSSETLNPSQLQCQFQSFDTVSLSPEVAQERLKQLRLTLAKAQLEGWLLPHQDQYQNEYLPPASQRLAWLTGFTGSAGLCIVLQKEAALFVDGRYTLQAQQEINRELYGVESFTKKDYTAWLKRCLSVGGKIGYDPWLFTPEQRDKFEEILASIPAQLVPCDNNRLDALWTDRPPLPRTNLFLYQEYAGESVLSKLNRLRQKMRAFREKDQNSSKNSSKGMSVFFISDPHDVAWLFNIRGHDLDYTPILLAYACVPEDGLPCLYLEKDRVPESFREQVQEYLQIHSPEALFSDLENFCASGCSFLCDSQTVPVKITQFLKTQGASGASGASLHLDKSPIQLMKAIKNEGEICGMRAAHLEDAIAFIRFLTWFAKEIDQKEITEIHATAALENYRRQSSHFQGLSFPTIAASNAHAAFPHYHVTNQSNCTISEGLFLLDSGGQYKGGTTDITRTLAIGTPNVEMKECFTRVLQGHIAIAKLIFPPQTTGRQLDAFARQPLWEQGLDFNHGTGHGVGAGLSVHEGPHSLSKANAVPLEAGMIVTNEPAYYKEGAWGIRIENVLLVRPHAFGTEAEKERGANDSPMLSFETLSLVPMDRKLIDLSLLTPPQLQWLTHYHQHIWEKISPYLDSESRLWLKEATAPL